MNQHPENELSIVFENFLEEYGFSNFKPEVDGDPGQVELATSGQKAIDINEEQKLISNFLTTPCLCGQNCQEMFSEVELFEARDIFRSLSKNEKNCFILVQLRSFQNISDQAKSARLSKARKRQKFAYRINANRHVCRDAFLFYHGETSWRLKNLQKHLREVGTSPPIHGS